MLLNLINKIKETLSLTLKKSDLVIVLETLNALVADTLKNETDTMISFIKDGKDSDKIVEALSFVNAEIKTNKDAIKYLSQNISIIEELGKEVLDLTMENFGKVIVRDSMSAKQVAIYSLMETYNFLVGAHSDLLIYIAYKNTSKNGFIYKRKEEFLKSSAKEYRAIMKDFHKRGIKKIVSEIDKLSDVVVTADTGLFSTLTTPNDRKFTLPVNKFDGNPLTIFGKWWVDIKISRAEKLEYDVKLLKLKLNALREKAESGNVSFELSKQIAYYENKIAALDKEIIDLLGE